MSWRWWTLYPGSPPTKSQGAGQWKLSGRLWYDQQKCPILKVFKILNWLWNEIKHTPSLFLYQLSIPEMFPGWVWDFSPHLDLGYHSLKACTLLYMTTGTSFVVKYALYALYNVCTCTCIYVQRVNSYTAYWCTCNDGVTHQLINPSCFVSHFLPRLRFRQWIITSQKRQA